MLQSALFLALVASSALASPFSSFSKREVGALDFGYEGNSGPNLWPGECTSVDPGQSPINIREGSADAQTGSLTADLVAQPNAALTNTGHSLDVKFDPAAPKASFVPEGETEAFEVQGFHFHTPSEHHVNGKYFDSEMHIVSKSAAGKISVLAVFFEMSETPQVDSLMSLVTAQLPLNGTTATMDVDFTSIIEGTNQLTGFHTYDGSLTTPECSTGVLWNVMDTPLPISVEEVLAMRAETGYTARFTMTARDEEPVFTPPVKTA